MIQQEIERRFLIHPDNLAPFLKNFSIPSVREIYQGYLNHHPDIPDEPALRIRSEKLRICAGSGLFISREDLSEITSELKEFIAQGEDEALGTSICRGFLTAKKINSRCNRLFRDRNGYKSCRGR